MIAVALSLALLPAHDCANVPAKVDALRVMVAAGWDIGPMQDALTNAINMKLRLGESREAVTQWAIVECMGNGKDYAGKRLTQR